MSVNGIMEVVPRTRDASILKVHSIVGSVLQDLSETKPLDATIDLDCVRMVPSVTRTRNAFDYLDLITMFAGYVLDGKFELLYCWSLSLSSRVVYCVLRNIMSVLYKHKVR
jgi:hypothetical protein